ncbi:MAG: outer-membrane lipoprotein carrier protein LolA [Alphaproteobacteria bacterium]|nr:outer-membrane lipoprotein carrier protein LolA [Alphaproteobacteria bacterium]MBV9419839.1 outer-membrane lipoprotein carrier protein LolA [Alphaproteobacteria bacterium]MBV9541603.1 outer-membrane lipoprotein carrier protein LolA [Alphaproteobacteria bacterium]MBV9905417.1 outer-membrane lipoprotein carrier protein LolA [Alphaproteobacteria bacterium]
MRRYLFALFVAAASPLFMGAGQQAPAARITFSDEDAATLDRVSEYLNGITTMKGSFIQIAPSGAMTEGTFYLSKPGRIRFEYKPPVPTLIVSDGKTIAVANTRLNTVDRYPLSETPLGLILSNTIDLRRNSAVLSVAHQQGSIVIGARTSKNRNKANITLVFSDPGLELRQWTVIDDQGGATTVALRGTEPGATLAPDLFTLPTPNPFARRRQG